MAKQKISRKKSQSPKTNPLNSKRGTRKSNAKSGETSKRKIFRRLQKPTKRKNARFYLKSRRPVELRELQVQRTIVLSLVASRGKKLELIDPRQVLPLIRKLRSNFKLKNVQRENVYVFLSFYMESGTKKIRTVFSTSNRPNAALKNNQKIVESITRFLTDGASQTKTTEKIYIQGVRIKRFYPRLKRKISKTASIKKKKK